MRKFASIPPRVWRTDLKRVRGDLEAIAVHYHLTTSGHANMLGLYYVPIAYIAHETGCPLEEALKGLRSLVQAGICAYDYERDLVWVCEMASDQIAPQLSPKDKRVKGIAEQLAMLPICPITLGFYGKYRLVFHLHEEFCLEEFEHTYLDQRQAPSNLLRSKEKEKDLVEEKGQMGSEGKNDARASIFVPYKIPSSATLGRNFLEEKGVPKSELDACLRNLLGGNLSPYDLEGVLSNTRGAA